MPRRPLTLPARAVAMTAMLALAGCQFAGNPLDGFGGFVSNTHSFTRNPNLPPGADENMAHAEGRDIALKPLLPEPGNIWPGPPPPVPTLTDVEKQQNLQLPPVENPPPSPPPAHRPTTRGSSTPPTPPPQVPVVPPSGIPPAQFAPPTTPAPGLPPVVNTPSGPVISNGSVGVPGGASTATNPTQGGQDIIVPNGNGTSTVISPDGSVRTIPTPR